MEPQSSLPYSQAPATCPYPEPTPSSPQTPSHFLKIHLNIIFPSMSWSPQWSLSLRFPHQNLVHSSPFLHTCHMSNYQHIQKDESSVLRHSIGLWWLVSSVWTDSYKSLRCKKQNIANGYRRLGFYRNGVCYRRYYMRFWSRNVRRFSSVESVGRD